MADESEATDGVVDGDLIVKVRRLHRRDLNRVWEFLKRVFRDVNRETVEYQRPRTKQRFLDVYEQPGIEQLLFEVEGDKGKADIVGYAECAFQISGADNWMNERYFTRRDMRPMYVEELAVSVDYQGRGIGNFLMDAITVAARVGGVQRFTARCLAENHPMRAILERFGVEWEREEPGVVTTDFEVPDIDKLRIDSMKVNEIRSMTREVVRASGG